MFSAQLENYEKSVEIFEQVAASCLESSLLKYSAKAGDGYQPVKLVKWERGGGN